MRPFIFVSSCLALAANAAFAQDLPNSQTLPPALAADVPPIVPPIVSPDVALEPEISVDELVSRALANNPQLPIARQTQEAARQRLRANRAFPSPVLQVVPGVGNREARDEEIILSQPLDLFGQRRAQSNVARAELRRAQAETTLAERALVVQVKNAAADLFAAQEAENLGTVGVEVARLFREAAARRAQLGDVPQVQVQRAELELLRVQNDLTQAQAERLARRAALNQLTGQAPQTPLRVALPIATGLTELLRVRPPAQRAPALRLSGAPGDATGGVPSVSPGAGVPQALPDTGATTPTASSAPVTGGPIVGSSSQVGSNLLNLRGQILPGALTNRPDVVGAQATLEARRAQVEVLRRGRLPSVELQARRSSVTGSGSTALRAVVVVPLFDFGSNRGERRALEAEVRAQEATISLLRSQVSAQVEQALIRLQQQREMVERYRAGIVPLSVDLLRKTQVGYAQGASTYLEVLEAQRTLRQVQTEYLQALVGTRTSEAQLESALGANVSGGLVAPLSNPGAPGAPPGVAAPGTVPEGTIPPNVVQPVNPAGAAPPVTGPTTPGTPATPANAVGTQGGR